jgi:hypothetical protein
MRAIGAPVGAFRAKELELKGINMDRSEGGEIKLTLVDYLPRYQEIEEKRKRLEEHVTALGVALGVTNLALGIGGVDLGSGGCAA